MISIKKVTKDYVSNNNTVTALKNVSFNLPDSGFVFITGNSGSGKSTLLNVLGGLDNITKGDVEVDGASFSSFTPADFDKYRNSYLGFIFQDYCLIEDLTIYQNLELVLDLGGVEDKSTIHTLLDKVHLSNCADRYPRELSGGQKQRIAIARALAKNPQLILADEPTGNLDSKTAKAILKILKELSKTKLVVVVSHNIVDAEEYGDRIIELADGRVVRDEEKVQGFNNSLERVGDSLVLSRAMEYTEAELSQMTEWVKLGKVSSVSQKKCGFYPTDNDSIKSTVTYTAHKAKLPLSKTLGLSWRFLKKRRLGFIMTTIIVSCMFVLLGVCQFFSNFDYVQAVNDAVAKEGCEVILGDKASRNELGSLDLGMLVEVSSQDISSIRGSGYTDFYKVYSTNISYGATHYFGKNYHVNAVQNLSSFYLQETYGTVVCSEDYLVERFGADGQLSYIGSLTDKSYGVIITDYMADSIVHHVPGYDTRQDVLGQLYDRSGYKMAYVNAIVDTDYESRYATFKEELMLEYATKLSQGKSSSFIYEDSFLDFVLDIESTLGKAYSISTDYVTTATSATALDSVNISGSYVSSGSIVDYYLSDTKAVLDTAFSLSSADLDATEIVLSTALYNRIFGTMYNSSNIDTFTPHSFTINKCMYRGAYVDKIVQHTDTFTIVALVDYAKDVVVVDESILSIYGSTNAFCYEILFADMANMGKLIGVVEDVDINIATESYVTTRTIKNIVDTFMGFLDLIVVGLCFICVLLLVNFSVSTIRRRKYEIGVIKAMGGSTLDVGKVFIAQVLFIGILVCILSSTMLVFTSVVANNILVGALSSGMIVSGSVYIEGATIIAYKPLIVVLDVFVMLLVTFVSAIVPIIKLHSIKPVNIIKHKN